ncbi:AraC family transcriptional regulator [Cohnella cholangitidis]|uniref:AraC family transcriptional regulator n=1 Tax=Cohnella cholangitidis TaxID=2598458 RepID=UPI001E4C3880|nr:AraC family transcriptional regulator [Cohnella cholangitidis]
MFCVSGEGWVTNGTDNAYRVTERTLAILPADTPHAYGADDNDPWSIYWFHVRGEHVGDYLKAIGLSEGSLTLSPRDAEKFSELFHQCHDVLTAKSYSIPHHLHVSQTVKYYLSLIGLIPGRKEEERKQQVIDHSVQFMRTKLDQTLTLEQLVSHAQISKQHLNYLFKSSTGYAPIDYYHRLKMQRAGQLLDLTDLTIKEICHSLGFADPYYFSRMFKKIIGISPSEYRSNPKG